MRKLALLLAVSATPALAHHEVVVATSIVPFIAWSAAIAAAGLTALRVRRKRRKALTLERSAQPADR